MENSWHCAQLRCRHHRRFHHQCEPMQASHAWKAILKCVDSSMATFLQNGRRWLSLQYENERIRPSTTAKDKRKSNRLQSWNNISFVCEQKNEEQRKKNRHTSCQLYRYKDTVCCECIKPSFCVHLHCIHFVETQINFSIVCDKL